MRGQMSLSFLLVLLCASNGWTQTSISPPGEVSAAVNCSACHVNATCTENVGGSVGCFCKAGFIGDGLSCSDIDECTNTTHGCSPGTCHNTIGSYYCSGSSNNYSSSDPCANHIVLNEPWRSTDHITTGTPYCDSELNGWYRFVGSAGIRMPEVCVPSYRCQTYAPLWLNGGHPAIGDGIVDRTVCGNWVGNCCHFSGSIQVKACPGGYYVYGIKGTPGCSLTYCTDPLAVLDVCEADEEWKLGNKGYGCYCKDEYNISSLSEIHPKLTCGLHAMKASFQKCQMKELDTHFGRENVKDNDCFDFEDDNATNTFSVLAPLQPGRCGVQSSQNGSHVEYTSTLDIELDRGIIMRNDTLSVTLSCVYELDMITSLNLALHPFISSINITVGGTGQFTATMALYKDSNYTTPYEGPEVSLSSKTILYIGVFIEGGDTSQYVVVMTNCYATPTQLVNDTLKYYIIKDSCPNKQDQTIKVLENGFSRQGRVSVQMFRFVGDYELVYLHCSVSLCDIKSGACQPSCSSRKSQRTKFSSYSHDLRIGPIIRSDPNSSVICSSLGFWTLLLPALVLLILSM